MATQYQRDLYKEVVDICEDVAALKLVMEKMLEVQEKQQQSLATIAACLEKISAAFGTDHQWNRNVLFTSVVNSADFPR